MSLSKENSERSNLKAFGFWSRKKKLEIHCLFLSKIIIPAVINYDNSYISQKRNVFLFSGGEINKTIIAQKECLFTRYSVPYKILPY